MTNNDLANKLARDLMALGDDPNSPAHRIQYMGGNYPDGEIPQGGMNETALACFFHKKLNEYGVNRP